MSDFYSSIEDATAAYLSTRMPAIRVESGVREIFFAADASGKGMAAQELPAVMVTATDLKETISRPRSLSEIEYTIPLSVVMVVKDQKKDLARKAVAALMRDVEQAIHLLRVSANAYPVLGPNAWISGDIASSLVTSTDSNYYYGMATVSCEIQKVVVI